VRLPHQVRGRLGLADPGRLDLAVEEPLEQHEAEDRNPVEPRRQLPRPVVDLVEDAGAARHEQEE
jgi:hypothetical protein